MIRYFLWRRYFIGHWHFWILFSAPGSCYEPADTFIGCLKSIPNSTWPIQVFSFSSTHLAPTLQKKQQHKNQKKKKSPYFASIFLLLANTSNVRLIAHTKYFRIILDSSISFTYSSNCVTTWCGQTEMAMGNVIHGPMVAHLYLRSSKILVIWGLGSFWITKMY